MKKKNDTELMHDFNLKYLNHSYDEFMSAIESNSNNSSLENNFLKIFQPKDFRGIGFNEAVDYKVKLNQLETKDPILKSLVEERLLLLEEEIGRSPGLFE